MAITDWPDQERPREKLLEKGAESLSNAELIAILFRTGMKGKTAVDLAREGINKFGGLKAFLDADRKDFCEIPGLGETKYLPLQAALELGRRYVEKALENSDLLSNSHETKKYLSAHLTGLKQEVFACLFLNTKNHLIKFEKLFHGTVNGASVYPREVAQRALQLNATKIILAHNHPSGDPTPSQSDRKLTKQLQEALAPLEIDVVDHMIIGNGQITSLAELGGM